MALNKNKVFIAGRLVADPECRAMQNGTAVTKFRVATSEFYKDKNGQRQEITEFHSVVAYRRFGEVAAQYLKKGSEVDIEGKLKTQKWQDKDGKDCYRTEIEVTELQFPARSAASQPASGRQDSAGTSGSQDSASDIPPGEWRF